MADERNPLPMEVPDFVREAEEAMARGETIALTASSITFRNRIRRFRHANVPMRKQSSLCLQS